MQVHILFIVCDTDSARELVRTPGLTLEAWSLSLAGAGGAHQGCATLRRGINTALMYLSQAL